MTTKYKVIVVDDEEDVNVIFELMLEDLIESEVFDYHYFNSGAGCLNYLGDLDDTDCILLVLSDINMPNMNGFALLEQIKSKFAGITVFMVSAYCEDSYVNQAKELGANDYLVKPVDFNVLRQKLLDKIDQVKKR